MQNQTSSTVGNSVTTQPISISKPIQLFSAFVLGAIIMYGVGFLNTSVAHNAAHDTRHSTGFPCH